MAWEFCAGQRVICILEKLARLPVYGETFPQIGTVYTIREVEADATGIWLRFVEIVNPTFNLGLGPVEAAFTYRAFRPLDDLRLDQFRAYLKLAPRQAEVV